MQKKYWRYIIALLILVIVGVNFMKMPQQYQSTIRFVTFAVLAGAVYLMMKEKKG